MTARPTGTAAPVLESGIGLGPQCPPHPSLVLESRSPSLALRNIRARINPVLWLDWEKASPSGCVRTMAACRLAWETVLNFMEGRSLNK